MRAFWVITISLCLIAEICSAFELPDRRRDQYGKDFAYYVYPIPGEIPGVGTAFGVGASVLNIGGNDADVTAYALRGDFDATGITLLDLHLIKQRLVFDVGYNDYLVSAKQYERGIDSPGDDFILPTVTGRYLLAQMTLTYDQRRYEYYYRVLRGENRLLKILDKDLNEFESFDDDTHGQRGQVIGLSFDFTDDRLDPRRGFRFEAAAKLPNSGDEENSEFYTLDFNFTQYFPLRKWDTLVFNLFHSQSHVTKEAETDFNKLQQSIGLDCQNEPAGADREQCLQTEAQFINQRISANKYGFAASLGGTQRLRSYDNYRFYAGNAFFYGLEYRWNLTDEYTPFNIYVAKGVRTGMQLAFFVEQGSVSDRQSKLFDEMRTSYGVGFRLILSGVIVRLDFARGDDGKSARQIFITYPFSMFSVDNPG